MKIIKRFTQPGTGRRATIVEAADNCHYLIAPALGERGPRYLQEYFAVNVNGGLRTGSVITSGYGWSEAVRSLQKIIK